MCWLVQAAYARQFLEQVSRRQTQLAGAGAAPAASDDKKLLGDENWGSKGEKRLKTEGGWVPTSVKPEAVPTVSDSLSISSLRSVCIHVLGFGLLAVGGLL